MYKTIILSMICAINVWAVHNLNMRNLSGDPTTTTEIYGQYKITGNFEVEGATADFLWWYDLNKNGQIEEDIDFCPIRRPEDLHNMTITDGVGGNRSTDTVVDGEFSMDYLARVAFAYPGNVIFLMVDNGVYDTIFYEAVFPSQTTGYCGQIKYADGTCAERLRIALRTDDISDPIPGTAIQLGGAGAITDENGFFCTYLKQDLNTAITMWVDDPMDLSNADFQQKFSNLPPTVANQVTDIGVITRNGSGGIACDNVAVTEKSIQVNQFETVKNEVRLQGNSVIFSQNGNAEISIIDSQGRILKYYHLKNVHAKDRFNLNLEAYKNSVLYIITKVNNRSRTFTITGR